MSFTSAFPTKLPLLGKRIISRSFSEAVGLLDGGITKSVAKLFSEPVGFLEAVAKTVSKPFTELLGLKDAGATKSISKPFSEAAGLLDGGITKSVTKVVSELLGLYDFGAVKSLTRSVSESIGLSDLGATKSLSRTLTELLGLREAFSKQPVKNLAEAVGLYEYWGYVYPYHDPKQALDKLIRILLVAKSLGIRIDLLLENPYIVYLIRVAARKMSGELYA